MDTDQNTQSNTIAVPPASPKDDNKILTDSGVQIVDQSAEKKEPEQQAPVSEPERKEAEPADSGIADLEETFKKELAGSEQKTASTNEEKNEIEKRLEALKTKIEAKKSGEKGDLERQLAEFKELKEKIEQGLAHIKELSALEEKIGKEAEKLEQAETLEKEVLEDVSTIEKEIEDSK